MKNLTEYYQSLQTSLEQLARKQRSVKTHAVFDLLTELATKGQLLEKKTNAFEVQAHAREMSALVKQLGPVQQIPQLGKRAVIALDTSDSVLLALSYYMHLVAYQDVAYDGLVGPGFFTLRSQVEASVNDKKAGFAIEAAYLKTAIKNYLKTNTAVDSSAYQLRLSDETRESTLARLMPVLLADKDCASEAAVQTPETLVGPQQARREAQQTLTTKQMQLAVFRHERATLQTALSDFNDKQRAYQALPLWQRALYWLASFIMPINTLTQLATARFTYQGLRDSFSHQFAADESAEHHEAYLSQQVSDAQEALNTAESAERAALIAQTKAELPVAPMPIQPVREAKPSVVVPASGGWLSKGQSFFKAASAVADKHPAATSATCAAAVGLLAVAIGPSC